MSLPDQLPDDPADTRAGIRLSRDSIILIAAAAFLGVALLLAVLFGSTPDTAAPAPTAIARATISTVPEANGAPSSTPPGTPIIASPIVASPLPIGSAPTIIVPTQSEPTTIVEPTVEAAGAYPPPTTPQPLVPTTSGTGNPPPPVPTIGALTTPSPPIFAPTVLAPTALPAPTPPPPPPTIAPATAIPAAPAPAQPAPTARPTVERPTPMPTAPPVTLLRGTTYWRAAQSPYVINQDMAITSGSALIIEPGVEIRLAPGVSISTDGKLYALGRPGQPIRFVGSAPQRWDGIYGRAGSEIIFEQVELRGAGAGGTVLASEDGALILRGARFNDNGGRIQAQNSRLEVRDSEIAGNDMPYGAALEATFRGGVATIVNNRIGGNRLSTGAPQVLVRNESAFDALTIEIRGNLLIGQDGPNLTLTTGTMPLLGEISCNALLNGANGLSIRSETFQTPGFPISIHDNAIDDHVPPIIPVYLKYGIGRGATSEVQLDMRGNWWGSELGPYEPDRHADGRGDSVGENIAFDPWLSSWPACAPRP